MLTDQPAPGSLSKIWLTWAALAALTVAAWTDSRHASTTATVRVILALTTVKLGLVMAVYMELDHAPTWLRAGATAWLFAVAGTLAVLLT